MMGHVQTAAWHRLAAKPKLKVKLLPCPRVADSHSDVIGLTRPDASTPTQSLSFKLHMGSSHTGVVRGGCRVNDRVNGCRQHTNFNLCSAVDTRTQQDSSRGTARCGLHASHDPSSYTAQVPAMQCTACMRCAWFTRENGRTGGKWRCTIGLAAWSQVGAKTRRPSIAPQCRSRRQWRAHTELVHLHHPVLDCIAQWTMVEKEAAAALAP